jgi:four helix bundle protein
MNNKEFAKHLEERTLDFASEALDLSASIEYSIESKVVRSQFSRSATSIGANYHEANRSRSKIRICEGESVETLYWIKLALRKKMLKESQASGLLKEVNELIAIFTSIGED